MKNEKLLNQYDRIQPVNMTARNEAIMRKKAKLANQQAKRSSLDCLI